MRDFHRPTWPALALAAILAAPAAAQDWTRFRGPNGTGISAATGVPVAWTEKDFRWRVAIPGKGDAQPVIWGDRIFLASATNEGRERLLLCLNKEDGRELWSKKYPIAAYLKGKNPSFSSSTPVVDKDRLVASFVDHEKYLVKAWDHTGRELWSVNLGSYRAQHGHAASPILFEDKVIVANDQDGPSFVTALDARTGKQAWRCARRPQEQGAAYSTPCILQRDGRKPELLLTSESHGISSIDPRTGALNWEAKVFDKRAVSSPVVWGDFVLGTCGSGGGGMYLAAVRLGGKGDVTGTHQVYTIRSAAPYVPTPLVVGDRVFLISDDGVASCFDPASGKVLWTERVGGGFFASPVCVDGKIYASSRQGECLVYEAADQFKLLAKNPIVEGSNTPPCVDGGRLYIKTFTHLVCVGGTR